VFINSGLATVTIATNPSQVISGFTFIPSPPLVTFFGKANVSIVYP
jgi:hypothetical protein